MNTLSTLNLFDTATVRTPTIIQDNGCTVDLPEGEYKVVVTKAWGDYEIGTRYWGNLVEAKDIEVSKGVGETGEPNRFADDPFRPEYSPARVLFGQFDLVGPA